MCLEGYLCIDRIDFHLLGLMSIMGGNKAGEYVLHWDRIGFHSQWPLVLDKGVSRILSD